jgi:hypothetical protein
MSKYIGLASVLLNPSMAPYPVECLVVMFVQKDMVKPDEDVMLELVRE